MPKTKTSPEAAKTHPVESTAARLDWSARTDVGRIRKNNEDAFLGLRFNAQDLQRLGKYGEGTLADYDYVFAVGDGMGGANAGEIASRIAIEKITTLLPREFRPSHGASEEKWRGLLQELFAQIHRSLVFLGGSYEECRGMETTLSLCWFTRGWMYFAHIGDSRIYHISAASDTPVQLTEDDTHVAWLLRNRLIQPWEARTHPRRNVLQKSLGGGNQFVEPQVGAIRYGPGDLLLLCTDGLTEGVYNSDRLVQLARAEAAPNAAHHLVAEALKNDGKDNITAMVVRINKDSEGPTEVSN